MQTFGYWCDECRRKYVRHMCKEKLPCEHAKEQAVYVSCQAFARSGESVRLAFDGTEVSLWIEKVRDLRGELWANNVTVDRGLCEGRECPLAVWLKEQPSKVIRAFDNRWDSFNTVPDWRHLEMVPGDAPIFEYMKSARERLGILNETGSPGESESGTHIRV